jgi:hypothetical protein
MAWENANCRDVPTSIFFPEDTTPEALALARSYCDGCPESVACLEESLTRWDMSGIWAGTSARQRVEIRRQRGLEKPPREVVEHGTRTMYLKERKAGKKPCEKCVQANTAYNRKHRFADVG